MSSASCDFCGLPVSVPRKVALERASRPVYCCFGCEFAADVTRSSGGEGANRVLLLRIGMAAFCTMNVLAFTMVLWTHDVYAGVADPRAESLDSVLRYLGLLFSLPVWFILGQPLLTSAFGNLRRGIPATDFLVCLGVVAAYGFSLVSTWRGAGPVYFEVACVVLVLITLGRWFEAQGKLQASSALDELEKLIPNEVRICADGKEYSVPIKEVQIGDRLRILTGECIPVDGKIVRGCAHIDERLLTGESWPAEKREGDSVYAGGFNLDGHLEVIATSTAAEGSLGRLVQGLREARQHRGNYERLAERVTAWFLPLIVVVAVGAFAWHSWFRNVETGLLAGLAVLLIACPCALGLATPLAVWTAFSQAAKRHVLFRSGEALERLAGVKAIAWDKTGTITTSEPLIRDIVWKDGIADEASGRKAFLHRLVSLASSSHHPFSKAVVNTFGQEADRGQLGLGIDAIRELPGRGIVGELADGKVICLGNARLAAELSLVWPIDLETRWRQLQETGQTSILGGWDGAVQCLMSVVESLRPGAADAVRRFQDTGMHQQLLTGDQAERAEAVAKELFHNDNRAVVPGQQLNSELRGTFEVRAGLLPDDKVVAIQELRANWGPVAMVGDGVNDALALTAADVGISLRSGADISRDSAAICLFGDDILQLPWAIEYAKFTVRIIRQNLFWAFGYNAIGVTLAAFGYLNPSLAALLMVGSSVFVIANTWRLTRHSTENSTIEADQSGDGTELDSSPVREDLVCSELSRENSLEATTAEA